MVAWECCAGAIPFPAHGDGGAGFPLGLQKGSWCWGGDKEGREEEGGMEHQLAGAWWHPLLGDPYGKAALGGRLRFWGGLLESPPPPVRAPHNGVTCCWGWLLVPELIKGSSLSLGGIRVTMASSGHVTSPVRLALGDPQGDTGILGSCQQWLFSARLVAGPCGRDAAHPSGTWSCSAAHRREVVAQEGDWGQRDPL